MTISKKLATRIVALSVVFVLLVMAVLAAFFAGNDGLRPNVRLSAMAGLPWFSSNTETIAQNPVLPRIERVRGGILVHYVSMTQNCGFLNEGDTVQTGATGAMHVAFDGATVIIAPNSKMILSGIGTCTDARDVKLTVLDGSIFVDVYRPLNSDESFEIHTPASIIPILGTSVQVRHDALTDISEVSLLKGTVRVICLASDQVFTHSVSAGEDGLVVRICETGSLDISKTYPLALEHLTAVMLATLLPGSAWPMDAVMDIVSEILQTMPVEIYEQYVQALTLAPDFWDFDAYEPAFTPDIAGVDSAEPNLVEDVLESGVLEPVTEPAVDVTETEGEPTVSPPVLTVPVPEERQEVSDIVDEPEREPDYEPVPQPEVPEPVYEPEYETVTEPPRAPDVGNDSDYSGGGSSGTGGSGNNNNDNETANDNDNEFGNDNETHNDNETANDNEFGNDNETYNDNENDNDNEDHNENDNDNDNEDHNENDNDNDNDDHNENDNDNDNDDHNDNENDNDNDDHNENDNGNDNDDHNENDNDNDNDDHNDNENDNDNDDHNENDNDNDNEDHNENDNDNDNEDHNENDNDNDNDDHNENDNDNDNDDHNENDNDNDNDDHNENDNDNDNDDHNENDNENDNDNDNDNDDGRPSRPRRLTSDEYVLEIVEGWYTSTRFVQVFVITNTSQRSIHEWQIRFRAPSAQVTVETASGATVAQNGVHVVLTGNQVWPPGSRLVIFVDGTNRTGQPFEFTNFSVYSLADRARIAGHVEFYDNVYEYIYNDNKFYIDDECIYDDEEYFNENDNYDYGYDCNNDEYDCTHNIYVPVCYNKDE